MARPTTASVRLADHIRTKIQAASIINRLQQHVDGEIELTATQIAAARELLDRSVPKLSQIQHVGDENQPVSFQEIRRTIVKPDGSGHSNG